MTLLAYFDTSLLVKRYVPEVGSNELETYLCSKQPHLMVSELSRLEFTSTLQRKMREGVLTPALVDAMQRQADEDLLSGVIEMTALDSQIISRGLTLMRTLKQAVATLDAIHLATALARKADMFLTNDKQLARAALETGLQVWPD